MNCRQMTKFVRPAIGLGMVMLAGFGLAAADKLPTALPDGKRPDDLRLGNLRTTDNGYFPIRPVADAAAWPARRNEIRTRILVAAGLHPLPEKTPLNAAVFGKVERDDYTVERVIFESFPGHFVTGSLYRPKVANGKCPAVLNPHGHWKNGRFQDHGLELIRKEIAAGAEHFEIGGRHIIQARCVQLARMGCIAFAYDMEGYADSVQLPHAAGPRPAEPGQPGCLFFSPQAELQGQTMFGLQTWNSLRALDFVCALPDVDAARIAVTGESGGGTQSMILAAVDERIAAAFPAVMVSTAMQGGCACENAPYLRIGQGNVDMAAAIAPRPLGLVCANDWTKEMETKGHPELKALYQALGQPGNYEAHFHLQFPHNYNAVNRQHLYEFINRHFKLGLPEPIIEHDYRPLDPATEASVWDAGHPKPAGDQNGNPHERQLTAAWAKATTAVWEKLKWEERTLLIGEAVTAMVGRQPAEIGPVTWTQTSQAEIPDGVVVTGMLTVVRHHEQVPVQFIYPKQGWNRQLEIWLADTGKAALFAADGRMSPLVADLMDAGIGVVSLDLFGQGEWVGGNQDRLAIDAVRMVPGKNPAAGFTFGYNPPLIIQRAHDVMSLVEYLQNGDGERKAARLDLLVIGREVGPPGMIAKFMMGDRIQRIAIDWQGFDFRSVDRLDHPMFLPGIARYGGLRALRQLMPPRRITEFKESEVGSKHRPMPPKQPQPQTIKETAP